MDKSEREFLTYLRAADIKCRGRRRSDDVSSGLSPLSQFMVVIDHPLAERIGTAYSELKRCHLICPTGRRLAIWPTILREVAAGSLDACDVSDRLQRLLTEAS